MASTINLQATLNWCRPFVRSQPLTIGGMEPALSNANLVLATILGPPFIWAWNRSEVQFACLTDGTQDYAVTAAQFGFLEAAEVRSPVGVTPADIKELTLAGVLTRSSEKARPAYITEQGDDGAGNISFRVQPAPDQTYIVNLYCQKKAPVMTSLASTWAPIPDELVQIFHWGYLGLSSLLVNDARWPLYNQRFISHLLGAQQALDSMKRNLFLGNWMETVKMLEVTQQRTAQGISARAQ